MAKKIAAPHAPALPPEKPAAAPSAPPHDEAPSATQESAPPIPHHADRILKAFALYAELYIDAQGGAFCVDTPPALRSNAALYKNPYHKT